MWERSLAVALTKACVGGPQDEVNVAIRLADTLGMVRTQWLLGLAKRYVRQFANGAAPRERDVFQFLTRDRAWIRTIRAKTPASKKRRVHEWSLEPRVMQPAPAAREWNVPALASTGALAEWLGLGVPELEWMADAKGLLTRESRSPSHHYHYRILRKPSGGLRLIEAPQARLKSIQRRILEEVLERVPQYYSAAHGFIKGRSVRTFAEPHVGQSVVLRIDLRDFFPTTGRARVQAVFRTMGYPEGVASVLAALCTNTAPRRLFVTSDATRSSELPFIIKARQLYCRPHLPQGAPTSPLLANMCAYRLDCRLTGLADWIGGTYTRYADDIAISGGEELSRNSERVAARVSAIAINEGWDVQHHKTRVMHRSVRQKLAGVVVNERLNVARDEYDRLKAILTNCVRHGADSQNREGHPDFRNHLRGRVAWVLSLNEMRGKRLASLFDRVAWN